MSVYKMDIRSWGPAGWIFLKAVALSLPDGASEEQKNSYRDFFVNCAKCLPCGVCSKHFEKYITEHPVPVDSPRQLAEWVQALHNEVNREAEKPEKPFLDALGEFVPAPLAARNLGLNDAETQQVQKANDAFFAKAEETQDSTKKAPPCGLPCWVPILLSLIVVLLFIILGVVVGCRKK